MALVSTFELLVKPIAPAGSGPVAVARTVVQGYFLTIANTSSFAANLRLQFNATTPDIDLTKTVTIRDLIGTDIFGDLVPTDDPRKLTYNLRIPARDTALVTFLPDANAPGLLAAKNLEIRGFVEIFRVPLAGPNYELLLTPEHRGTFLPSDPNAAIPDYDQLAYAIPTANGGSFYKLSSIVVPGNITANIENGQSLDISGSTNEMQQLLGTIAERIDEMEQRMAPR